MLREINRPEKIEIDKENELEMALRQLWGKHLWEVWDKRLYDGNYRVSHIEMVETKLLWGVVELRIWMNYGA